MPPCEFILNYNVSEWYWQYKRIATFPRSFRRIMGSIPGWVHFFLFFLSCTIHLPFTLYQKPVNDWSLPLACTEWITFFFTYCHWEQPLVHSHQRTIVTARLLRYLHLAKMLTVAPTQKEFLTAIRVIGLGKSNIMPVVCDMGSNCMLRYTPNPEVAAKGLGWNDSSTWVVLVRQPRSTVRHQFLFENASNWTFSMRWKCCRQSIRDSSPSRSAKFTIAHALSNKSLFDFSVFGCLTTTTKRGLLHSPLKILLYWDTFDQD
jgi:hypothetical protein